MKILTKVCTTITIQDKNSFSQQMSNGGYSPFYNTPSTNQDTECLPTPPPNYVYPGQSSILQQPSQTLAKQQLLHVDIDVANRYHSPPPRRYARGMTIMHNCAPAVYHPPYGPVPPLSCPQRDQPHLHPQKERPCPPLSPKPATPLPLTLHKGSHSLPSNMLTGLESGRPRRGFSGSTRATQPGLSRAIGILQILSRSLGVRIPR